ncbi:MAG: ABC transporter ATP-binding protein [Planctomycetes bacterium]|nr:ABC transporter ATP-binding protein [Planctomycetota bacterium]
MSAVVGTGVTGRGLTLQRGERTILAGVDFALGPGELVLLAGRNGAGKTTLLRLLLGAEPPGAGTVTLGDRPIAEWEPHARARSLAFVEQSSETPFEFTGRQLVAMGRYPHLPRGAGLRHDDELAVERALAAVDAAAFCDRPITTLSGGEQRRIAVARALATEAPLMLLDEPFANLDLEHALQLVALLRRVADAGHGVLVASHELNLVAPQCDRVALLHGGRIDASGPPESVLAAARVTEVFGVEAIDPAGYFPRDFRLP